MSDSGLLALLPPRKRQVLDLLARGFTNQAIAHEMTVTTKTVENYLTDLYSELGIDYEDKAVNPRVKAAIMYMQHGQQGPVTLWRGRYRQGGEAALSDDELDAVVGGIDIEGELLRLIEQAHE